jgi:UDP-N-acetylmuramate dehydrogenase
MNAKTEMFRVLNRAVRGRLIEDEPMSGHTSFRIGGPADFYFHPKDLQDLAAGLKACAEGGVPVFVIGRGTNLLVADAGFRGVVFDLSESFSAVSAEGPEVTAGAGGMLWDLLDTCAGLGLSGLEALTGIPGSVGGGIRLNAGAFGREIRDRLVDVTTAEPDGTLAVRTRDDLRMEYRRTALPAESVVVSARFVFESGDPDRMKSEMEAIIVRRREKQPLSMPSAGSVFKRPPGDFAGRLIEDAGLKGLRIGDAMVSGKHANFIVNIGSASASDVKALIDEIRSRVSVRFAVTLEPEIHFLGFGGPA